MRARLARGGDGLVEDMLATDRRARLTAKGIGVGLAAAALCLSLGACGVRGALDPPPSAKAAGTARSAEAAGTSPESAAPPKPHEGFVLDPLLR